MRTHTNPVVTILPAQAFRISQEAAKIGAAIGVSQSGSYPNALIIDTGRGFHVIDVSGSDVESY